MNHKQILINLILVALLAALAVGGTVLAQTSTSFDLEWHVIGGGGQPVTSASFAVNSTTGQGAASPPYSVSAHYAVSGGYWLPPPFPSYLPLLFKNS